MKQKLVKWFNIWNDYSKCPKCKSRNQKDINIDRLDGYGSTILEYNIVCADCGQYLNHYAYGHFEVPDVKTEYLRWLWGCGNPSGIKCYCKTVIETFRIIFSF